MKLTALILALVSSAAYVSARPADSTPKSMAKAYALHNETRAAFTTDLTTTLSNMPPSMNAALMTEFAAAMPVLVGLGRSRFANMTIVLRGAMGMIFLVVIRVIVISVIIMVSIMASMANMASMASTIIMASIITMVSMTREAGKRREFETFWMWWRDIREQCRALVRRYIWRMEFEIKLPVTGGLMLGWS
ncbi:hypothetical protein E4T47_03834 [Aureobasidium subglaciale]|nr:hypothetical protein E4T47_03834 [Aureobasidium subglaciale]